VTDPTVHIDVKNDLGHITLDRPQVINALTHDMVRAIDSALREWEHDERVRAVLIRGEGDRGLCAGGDIRAIYADAKSGGSASLEFWADEYRLNARIARYPKPYLALMDGLVMGGGVGISAHGSIRVVTERSRVGMPETGIGFVPDVGGTYLLSRAPGQIGVHMALTGAPISGADAISAGFADSFMSSARIPDLLQALEESDVDAAIARFLETPPLGHLAEQLEWINACYAAETVEEILAQLHAVGGEAEAAAGLIEGKSPLALKLTLRALRTAATLQSLEAVLKQEYRLSSASLRSHDLLEGIRAQIIDKDRNPRWSPPTLNEVTDDMVAAFFEPTDAPGLSFEIGEQ
jgi:enoyl-CoA hydratase